MLFIKSGSLLRCDVCILTFSSFISFPHPWNITDSHSYSPALLKLTYAEWQIQDKSKIHLNVPIKEKWEKDEISEIEGVSLKLLGGQIANQE